MRGLTGHCHIATLDRTPPDREVQPVRCSFLLLTPVVMWASQLEVLTLPNWQRVPVGELSMVEGGATVARVNGPASGFTNPAGLAHLVAPSVSGSLSGIEYTRVGSRTSGGTAEADQFSLKPNLVGFANTVDDDDASLGGWSFTLASPVAWGSAIEVRTKTATGERRDDGRSSFAILVPGLAWGRPVGNDWSIGFSLESWLTEYRFDSGTAARDGSTVLTSSYTETGRQLSLSLSFGTQWQVGGWQVGSNIRTPGLVLSSQGEISSATTSGDGTSVSLTDVRDNRAGFTYPIPFSATVGAAWRPDALPQFQVEGDLALYGGSVAVSVFGATQGTITTISGATTTTTGYQQEARRLDQRFVVNPRLGLSYQLAEPILRRTVTLHLGGYMDRSPISSSDVFTRLNLLGGTAGISTVHGPMHVTFGAAYITSSSLTEALGYVTSPGSGLQPALSNPDTAFAVRTFVLAIGSSYRF
jgi:hypothetical protein